MLHRKNITPIRKQQNYLDDSLLGTLLVVFTIKIDCETKMKEPYDLDKNQSRATYYDIKTLFDLEITFTNLMLQMITFINRETQPNYRNCTLLETLLDLVTKIIFCSIWIKLEMSLHMVLLKVYLIFMDQV